MRLNPDIHRADFLRFGYKFESYDLLGSRTNFRLDRASFVVKCTGSYNSQSRLDQLLLTWKRTRDLLAVGNSANPCSAVQPLNNFVEGKILTEVLIKTWIIKEYSYYVNINRK